MSGHATSADNLCITNFINNDILPMLSTSKYILMETGDIWVLGHP